MQINYDALTNNFNFNNIDKIKRRKNNKSLFNFLNIFFQRNKSYFQFLIYLNSKIINI